MMTPLIVLANSWKRGDYCLAGISPAMGRWIRPVSDLDDGRVPKKMMRLWWRFPRILDVIEVPLADNGPDFGFESENRAILPGRWRHAGRATIADILSFAVKPSVVLHNSRRFVTLEEMQRKEPGQRVTLQLVRVDTFSVRRIQAKERNTWSSVLSSGQRSIEMHITDPVYHAKLDKGHCPATSCLLAVSLSMPWVPPDWTATSSPPCWKLIAGVIELAT